MYFPDENPVDATVKRTGLAREIVMNLFKERGIKTVLSALSAVVARGGTKQECAAAVVESRPANTPAAQRIFKAKKSDKLAAQSIEDFLTSEGFLSQERRRRAELWQRAALVANGIKQWLDRGKQPDDWRALTSWMAINFSGYIKHEEIQRLEEDLPEICIKELLRERLQSSWAKLYSHVDPTPEATIIPGARPRVLVSLGSSLNLVDTRILPPLPE